MMSFLTNRKQRVKIEGDISEETMITCGVPQGSPLSCVLFLIYVSDLPKWLSNGFTQSYADDTFHDYSNKDSKEVVRHLETEAMSLLNYFRINELVANPGKTTFIMFAPNKLNNTRFQVNIDGKCIEESDSAKMLGICIQSSLSWEKHTLQVISKMNHGLALMRQLRGTLTKDQMKQIGDGLVMSHARYGIAVYLSDQACINQDSQHHKNITQIQTKQNDLMRMIVNKTRGDRYSREQLLKDCNMKSINHILCESILCELWGAFSNNRETITNEFQSNISSRNGPTLRTVTDQQAFASIAAQLWNRTSSSLRQLNITNNQARSEIRETIKRYIPKI